MVAMPSGPEVPVASSKQGFSLVRRCLHSVFNHGVVHNMRWGWFHLNEHYFERLLGISTGRDDVWNARSYQGKTECVQYEPLPYALIGTILRSIEKRDLKNDVFLDYGCGLGRVVFMAARRPFKRVIGVELMPALVDVAKQNAARASRRLKSQVAFESADAATFVVPDDVTFVHLFNPFRGRIMQETQERIRESLVRVPRPLTIFYAHPPDQENLFAKCSYVSLRRRLEAGALRGMSLLVYEHQPKS